MLRIKPLTIAVLTTCSLSLMTACGGGGSESPAPPSPLPQVTVTFDPQGGTPTPAPLTLQSGSTVALPAAPTRTGLTFMGWYTQAQGQGSAFTSATPVTQNITVYAKWVDSGSTWTWPTPTGPTLHGNQTLSPVDAQDSSPWASMLPPMAGMKILNNTWGMEGSNLHGTGTCTIFREMVNGAYTFGWAWNLTSTVPGQVIAYPEVGWGWSPNSGTWFNGETPIYRINEGKTYTVDFNIRRVDRSGTWNTAFDIWIYPMTHPTGGSGGFKGGIELMIWLDRVNQGPWGSNPQNVTLGGHSWTAYNNDGSAGWKVISYLNAGDPINDARGFNLTEIINDAVTRYGIPASNYINAIEFGSEICGSTGMMEVANYAINIQ